MGTVRTFIAFDTPDPVKEAMSNLQTELKRSQADVRWESSQKFHATIKFLGDVQENKLLEVLEQIRATVSLHQSFEVVYQSLGIFPDKRHPKVVWIGCSNYNGELMKLKNALDIVLKPYGFPIEVRTFHPHITLGRVKSECDINDLLSMLENLTFEPRSARIDRIVTLKSTLTPHGSEYTVLASAPLFITI